jgi:hypothetical protein
MSSSTARTPPSARSACTSSVSRSALSGATTDRSTCEKKAGSPRSLRGDSTHSSADMPSREKLVPVARARKPPVSAASLSAWANPSSAEASRSPILVLGSRNMFWSRSGGVLAITEPAMVQATALARPSSEGR